MSLLPLICENPATNCCVVEIKINMILQIIKNKKQKLENDE